MSRRYHSPFIGMLITIMMVVLFGCSDHAKFSGGSAQKRGLLGKAEQGGDGEANALKPSYYSQALRYNDSSDPLKLVLIVDDSSSMVPKQQQLAKGLDIALEAVKGKNVSVYLYSSSIFARSYGFFRSNYLNNYGLAQFPIPNPYNEKIYATWSGMHYSAILSDTAKPSLDVVPRVKKNGVWIEPTSSLIDFVPEAAETRFVINRSAFNSGDGSLQFTDAMTADQFAAMKAKLKQEIIIGDRGNPEEMPLCTLAALLQNDGPNKIFASKDRVAFVIISDEDQTTKLAACPSGHQVTAASINQNAKGVGYALQSTVVMDYQAKCDSTTNDTYCGKQPWIQRQHTSCKTNPLCEKTVLNGYAPCSAAQRADYLDFFRATYANELASGKYRISDNDTCTTVSAYGDWGKAQTAVEASWTQLDPRPFVMAGKSYTSISAYFETIFPNDIFIDSVRWWTQYSVPTGGFINIDGVSKAEDLPGVLRKRATELFGQGNFTISVIGNTGSTATSGCSVDPAAESKILFNAADTKASVCDADYSKGLSWLEGFGFKKLVLSYKFSPQYLTDEFGLYITSNGNDVPLTADQYAYDASIQMLTLKINVPYAKDAQIVVRKK